jgi:hypothetical protein
VMCGHVRGLNCMYVVIRCQNEICAFVGVISIEL